MAPDGVRRRCWVAAVCEKQGRGSESRIRVLHSLAAKHTTSMNSSRKPRSNGSQHSRNMQVMSKAVMGPRVGHDFGAEAFFNQPHRLHHQRAGS